MRRPTIWASPRPDKILNSDDAYIFASEGSSPYFWHDVERYRAFVATICRLLSRWSCVPVMLPSCMLTGAWMAMDWRRRYSIQCATSSNKTAIFTAATVTLRATFDLCDLNIDIWKYGLVRYPTCIPKSMFFFFVGSLSLLRTMGPGVLFSRLVRLKLTRH